MTMFIPVLSIIILPSAFSFVSPSDSSLSASHGSRLGTSSSALSYTKGDDSESTLNLSHQATPTLPLNTIHSPFLSLVQDADSWKEWQYSFSRNGLTDFLPQFELHLDCLAIDINTAVEHDVVTPMFDGVESTIARLPWQYGDDDFEQATSSITSIATSTSSSTAQGIGKKQAGSPTAAIANLNDATNFDCILDGGVMNGIISSLPETVTWHSRTAPTALLDLVKLMQEATHQIREFGIYVAITESSIPDHARAYLDKMGEVLGLVWDYDLDGLTKEGYSVSVARKHFAGVVNFDPFSGGTGTDADGDDTNLLMP